MICDGTPIIKTSGIMLSLARYTMQKIDKIKIDEVKYKVISQRKIKNKTSFFLEVDND